MKIDQRENARVDAMDLTFTVTDLKQFDYCPRVVYFEQCLPHLRPRTHKMDMGHAAHERERALAARRTTHKYGLPEGERQFEVRLSAPGLRLHGLIDEVVTASDGEIFPVDYKVSKKVSPNHRIQVAAYGLMLEEAYRKPVNRGFIYLIPQRKAVEIRIDRAARRRIAGLLSGLFETVVNERMPKPTAKRNRCSSCEFHRFCNDV